MEGATVSVKVLLCGDVKGQLGLLAKQVSAVNARQGPFDLLICCGSFLGSPDGPSTDLPDFVTGTKTMPISTYFIEGGAGGEGAALIASAKGGQRLAEDLEFIGGCGIKVVKGLRIAFLSGRYDKAVSEGTHDGAASGEDQGGDSEPFVGSNYTPMAMKTLLSQREHNGASPSVPIDLLVTSEWPQAIDGRLPAEDKSALDELLPSDKRAQCSSPTVSRVAFHLSPRYHIAATSGVFYQRPPYDTLRGYPCRFISLGGVGSPPGKATKWLHAIKITPGSSLLPADLNQLPSPCTPNPFLDTFRDLQPPPPPTERPERPAKRMRVEGPALAPRETPIVFLTNLPFDIERDQLVKVMKGFGEIEWVHLDLTGGEGADSGGGGGKRRGTGRGWIKYATAAMAEEATKASEQIEAGNRMIRIMLHRGGDPRRGPQQHAKGERGEGGHGRPRGPQPLVIDMQPHAECWFCLANPKVEQHLIVHVGDKVYVAMAKGGLAADHVLVIPINHYPYLMAGPPDMLTEVMTFLSVLRQLYHSQGRSCVVFERYVPMHNTTAAHTQLQVVPIPKQLEASIGQIFEARAKEANLTYERLERREPMPEGGSGSQGVGEMRQLAERVNNAKMPYLYLELPGDNTARGRQVDSYLITGGPSKVRIPLNLGREALCEALGSPEKADWKRCALPQQEEERLCMRFRKDFKTVYRPGK
ncbi:unnamed protein product [Vitrella brassicaformis CCMP3155]|uniref:RRM domain-containing protein n=3 Tax=Vitrella brassicaformis TaxID=1169539 RepID=A0A0G4F058_VITBC|nr:unnamed protein product [Vitrella brassicaformis CCMP3155]|mmetsp:Transcript_2259/g.6109  ORF Transcript_2259/g.6109 Transcript_2259/m.6109 type:complete len:700 (-) Transcript_2259:110-2209(-)|eukprot:CEM04589.1 unnamed protein product [Vitrella brassicaformis CCMP3155]